MCQTDSDDLAAAVAGHFSASSGEKLSEDVINLKYGKVTHCNLCRFKSLCLAEEARDEDFARRLLRVITLSLHKNRPRSKIILKVVFGIQVHDFALAW